MHDAINKSLCTKIVKYDIRSYNRTIHRKIGKFTLKSEALAGLMLPKWPKLNADKTEFIWLCTHQQMRSALRPWHLLPVKSTRSQLLFTQINAWSFWEHILRVYRLWIVNFEMITFLSLPGSSKVHKTLAVVSLGSDSNSTDNKHRQMNWKSTQLLVSFTELIIVMEVTVIKRWQSFYRWTGFIQKCKGCWLALTRHQQQSRDDTSASHFTRKRKLLLTTSQIISVRIITVIDMRLEIVYYHTAASGWIITGNRIQYMIHEYSSTPH